MANQLHSLRDFLRLRFGSEGKYGPWSVWRVPGGWIFHSNREGSEVFVPEPATGEQE